MAEAKQGAAPKAAEKVLEKGLLDQIVEEGRMAKDSGAKERGKDLVKEFVAGVLDGSMTVTRDAETMINARIAQIDHLISLQLNEVMHNPAFQKLESSWRGLKYLVSKTETSRRLRCLGSQCEGTPPCARPAPAAAER